MIAAGTASGARLAIAHYFRFWMTPVRLRRITIALGCAALLASTVTVGGSSAPTRPSDQAAPAVASR
jgi:hypothetical protein